MLSMGSIVSAFHSIVLILFSDINECERTTDNCSEDAQCADTDGSFICTCNTGYSGNGVNCTST